MSKLNDLKTPRTTEGLRDMLFEELDLFREGRSSIKRAQVIVNFAREIINASRLEIVHAAMLLEANKNGKKPTMLLGR